jgi:single-stranded-DNA-specific exonuclease
MPQPRWILPDLPAAEVARLAGMLGIGNPAAGVLFSRGLRSPDTARRFLQPTLAALHDPHLLLSMDAALTRLLRAIRDHEKILIYGDYDVDGTTSVVILKTAIELAGGHAGFHVPHRLKDGYGMRPEVVEAAAEAGIRLIVSVDTGIRAAQVVARAAELGIDVIVTDHHLPEAELPPALAVLNPNRPGCLYPEKNLCGVGVAFKLVQALMAQLAWPQDKVLRITESFLKLVAIGTVADVVPLTGENRIIVKHGLDGLKSVRNPGLRALLDVAGFSASVPSATQVAFRIAPRINAAGRMDTANAVIEMFLTQDRARARALAEQLHALNTERQQAEADTVKSCLEIPFDESQAGLVYCGDSWHRGVLGIVASRVVDRYHRPVFVLSRTEDGLAQGSGRSIPKFHLLNALESMPGLFLKFGGHEHAAGVTLPFERVEEFRERFQKYANSCLRPEDFQPQLEIDALIDFADITDRSVEEIFQLAPFGCGNPNPVFAVMNAEVLAPPQVWKEKHLKLAIRQNGRNMSLKAWNQAERAPELDKGSKIDAAITFEQDEYSAAQGYQPWGAILKHFRRAAAATAALILVWFAHVKLAGQAAVSLSKPGQEELTFWANHNGVQSLEVAGEVGFGDMARILMRRRANAERFRQMRDRFTFPEKELGLIHTPDTFRVKQTAKGLEWENRPQQFVIAAGNTFNLPLIVRNQTGAPLKMQACFTGTTSESRLPAAEVPANSAGGYFLRVVESQPGTVQGKLTVNDLSADIRFDVRPLATLKVELPVAARIYLTGSDGLAYAPRGSISRITAMSAEYFFHAENSFEIDLPAGETTIEAARGQEYELTRQTIDLKKPETVRVDLKRWTNMAAQGWYSADAHIHANYTAPDHQVIHPKDIRLQTYAEDLNNANLMVANSGGAFIHDAQYFEGRPHALSMRNFVMYWNEEMRNSGTYGHMSFFKLKTLVEPLYTGFRNTPFWEDYPPNYTLAAAAQKQGGAVTYVHPGMQPRYESASARELPVDLALGQVDAMDVMSNNDEIACTELYYRLLNCGFRLAISAGTDSFTNVADHYTPGGGRVYVHAGNELRYDEWVANYKRGRSFVSNGPIVQVTVDGTESGGEVRLRSAHKVRIHASCLSYIPVDKCEVVVNGKVAISRDMVGKRSVMIDESVEIPHSSWIAARALGPWHRMVLNDIQAYAHTSPVYVLVGEEKIGSPQDARYWVEWIDKLIAQVNTRGRFATPGRKKEVVDLFLRAREVYKSRS